MNNNRFKRKNNINKKSKYIILTSFLGVILFMSIGYAILSQSLEINGEANLYASHDYLWYVLTDDTARITNNNFTESTFESNKYNYIGDGTNNYLSLNGDLWQILSIENDKTIKVIKLNTNMNYEFDTENNRTSLSTYCDDLTNGCNAWSNNSTLINDTKEGIVENNSTLLTYLNETFYESLSYKELIEEHTFNTGAVLENSNLSSIISNEENTKWNGNIGLLNISDILLINNISDISINSNPTNFITNYANNNNINIWTLNPLNNNTSKVWSLTPNKSFYGLYSKTTSNTEIETTTNNIVVPVMYLKNNIKYESGVGTMDNPFILQS